MTNQNSLIRRVGLKIFLIGLIALIISSCDQAQDDTAALLEISKITLVPSNTYQATPEPSSEVVSPQNITPELTNVVLDATPAITTPACLRILSPADGASFMEDGQIIFEWEPYSEATKYRLEILTPNGKVQVFETFITSINRYLNTLPWGGIYTWRVAVLGLDGRELCLAGPFSFTKPEYIPPTEAQESNKTDKGPATYEGRGG
jgi:hypothetical protein